MHDHGGHGHGRPPTPTCGSTRCGWRRSETRSPTSCPRSTPTTPRPTRDNAAELRRDLEALDAEYRTGLAECARREIVVSHAAFGYLAERYDLTQLTVSGLSPEDEPTPQRLAEAVTLAEQHGATTIFFETLASDRVATVIAEATGATTAVLDPIEGLAPDSTEDYVSLMRANLAALRAALDCR